MRTLLARVRLATDVLLRGPMVEPPPEPPLMPIVDPWTLAELAAARQEAALALLDDDVAGYLLIRFLREDVGMRCSVDVAHVMQDDWWPIVREYTSAT